MKLLEKSLKALANKRRLEILRFLNKEKEASVSDIARTINLSFKSTSRHLAVLSSADIVEREQRSLQVFYSLTKTPDSIVRHVLGLL